MKYVIKFKSFQSQINIYLVIVLTLIISKPILEKIHYTETNDARSHLFICPRKKCVDLICFRLPFTRSYLMCSLPGNYDEHQRWLIWWLSISLSFPFFWIYIIHRRFYEHKALLCLWTNSGQSISDILQR